MSAEVSSHRSYMENLSTDHEHNCTCEGLNAGISESQMLQTFIFMYSFSCLEIVSWEQPILSTVLIYICWEILNVWNVHMRKQARLMIHYLKNKGILSLFSFCYNPVSQCHKRILLCLSQKLTLLHSPSP